MDKFDDDNPNADTILAIEEAEALINDPDKKVYSTFSELLEELFSQKSD